MNEEIMHKQQKILGILCILLPILSVGFGIVGWLTGVNPTTWFNSISDTYYANSKMMMIGLLCACGIYFWAYKGYDKWDNITTCISAITAFMIVAFPCYSEAEGLIGTKQGLFCLPIEVSQYVHNISALVLYTTFGIQVLRFRKHGESMTFMKKVRNEIYLCCFILMVVGTCIVLSHSFIPVIKEPRFDWFTLLGETFLQIGFGFAWLVKGECIKFLNDK